MPAKITPDSLAACLAEYLGQKVNPTRLEIVPDPVRPVLAVRYRGPRGFEFYLVPESLDVDEIEEVEFKTWPPKPDAFHRRGGTES